MGLKKVKFDKIKLLFKDILFRINDDNVFALASQLSYSIFFSIFPFMIFLMAVLALFTRDGSNVLEWIRIFIPGQIDKFFSGTIIKVVESGNAKLLPISLIGTFYAASTGISAVISCLNMAYDEKETRSLIKVGLISIIYTVFLMAVLIFVFVFLIFGEVNGKFLSDFFHISVYYKIIWNYFRIIFSSIILFLLFVSLYYFIPCRKLTLKEVLPGSIFSEVGWFMISVMFSFYINNFTSYNVIYGSIGGVMAFLTWIYFCSLILLIGGELNASLKIKV